MEDKLDLIELFIEDEFGNILGDLSLISFVSNPAIEQGFQLFSTNKFIFAQTSEEKQIVTGPSMRPNFPILRQRKDGTYYNCIFSEEQVRRCSEIYFKNSNHKFTNLEHGELLGKNEIEGVYVVESWIVEDPKTDKATALGFKEVNKGDWYITYKVENKEFWEYIKSNGGGFSIEGVFADRIIESFDKIDEQKRLNEIKEIVYSDNFSDKEKEMKIKKILNIEKK